MTAKHFEAIAVILGKSRLQENQADYIQKELNTYFKFVNPRFNSDRFYDRINAVEYNLTQELNKPC